ncbi:TolC family protein [Alloacidobacterium sp.]|uniref:TolC family protein n=1 Tax=Alloacidobacterium sp. TaxID=2951999 RepID=UPI002D2EA6D3|nr:TolC family protein [Alloacidobacterium sp.]HYK35255.1 TolC family protein [Alloacidobacterium sp.]
MAVALCCLVSSSGMAQTAPSQPTTQTPPDAPSAQQQQPASPTIAQQNEQMQRSAPAVVPFHVEIPHSHNPIRSYTPSDVPELSLTNSPRLEQLIRDGKIYLSLKDAIALALENNLDLAYFRYNLVIADMDLARTRAGGQVRGVNTGVVQGTQGGFNAANTGGGGGAPSSSGGAGAVGAGGLVQSTLGSGTAVNSFDPVLSVKSYVDHTTQQEPNVFQVGVPLLKQNTIDFTSQYSQSFPLGTNIQVGYIGQRYTINSPYFAVNPNLFSNFQATISQPLLAGFGFGTNERYIRIAKKNKTLTNLAFKAQAIATISQVEDIYWDLVSAYQDEQVKERSLTFAQQTLDDDQKQLQLQAIPAMQVLKDQADVATREGDLTVAKATLRLNELLIKNILTKEIDDPQLADMPVVPLDLIGTPDANEGKPIDTLIAEAEKNRPDVSQDQIAMEIAQDGLKAIKNALLPQLNVYGFYAGSGAGGPVNPNCSLGPDQCSTTLPPDFGTTLQNTFNYTAPEYQVGFQLNIVLRNRIAKADQFRAVLEFRQNQLTFEEQKKNIRFDVRNSQYALQQSRASVDSLQKARDLAQKTFDVTKQEQQLGSKSSLDTLNADHDLAVAESALFTAQAAYEKRKVDIDRATGETLDRMGVSIDDAKSGVVTHSTP